MNYSFFRGERTRIETGEEYLRILNDGTDGSGAIFERMKRTS